MSDVKRGREFLHTPGPTNIPDRILNAMHQPAVDFTAPPFVEMTRSCFEDIKHVFQTQGPVFMYAATSSRCVDISPVDSGIDVVSASRPNHLTCL